MGNSIVFTNGCFDVFHYGHLHLLKQARKLGDALIVGINSDESIRRLKGEGRPIFPLKYRSELLASLIYVDGVIAFNDDTPIKLIEKIVPHVLVKGGDWKTDEIVGADYVIKNGGIVKTIPYLEGFSSTKILQNKQYGKNI